jgi:hypothetical protein
VLFILVVMLNRLLIISLGMKTFHHKRGTIDLSFQLITPPFFFYIVFADLNQTDSKACLSSHPVQL